MKIPPNLQKIKRAERMRKRELLNNPIIVPEPSDSEPSESNATDATHVTTPANALSFSEILKLRINNPRGRDQLPSTTPLTFDEIIDRRNNFQNENEFNLSDLVSIAMSTNSENNTSVISSTSDHNIDCSNKDFMIRIAEADNESLSDNDDDDDVNNFNVENNVIITRDGSSAIIDDNNIVVTDEIAADIPAVPIADITAQIGSDRFGIASIVRSINLERMDFTFMNASSIVTDADGNSSIVTIDDGNADDSEDDDDEFADIYD